MEKKAIRLVSQKPMRETEWTTPNGEKKVIASKELEFSDGIDSFLAEAQDEMARSLEKNPLADGTVVPAGKGIGCLPELLKDFSGRGGEAVTVEPHLQVFEGFSDLERDHKTPVPRFAYPSSDAAFDAACQALKALL